MKVDLSLRVLKAGVPLTKPDNFGELLEDGDYRLTSSTSTRKLSPFILKEEEERIKGEVPST